LKIKVAFFTFILIQILWCFQGQSTEIEVQQNDVAIKTGIDFINQLREMSEIPGLSVSIGRNGKILWEQGFGLRDIENNVSTTSDTVFRIGSVSKIVTIAAAARLYERGVLDIDAPIEKYVPGLPDAYKKITARQLAGHLGGVRHYKLTDQQFSARHFDSIKDSLEIFTIDPLQHEPGTKYLYSTFGYVLLSAVVEAACKTDFIKCLKDEVLDPLKMTQSGPDFINEIIPGRTRYYERSNGRILHAPFEDPSYKWAGGGLIATTSDLVRFGMAHLTTGYLKQETLNALFTSQRTTDGTDTEVGLGWRIGSDWKERKIYHHAGNIYGGRAVVILYPESNLAISLATNLSSQPSFVETTAQMIAESFMAQDMNVNTPKHFAGSYQLNGIDKDKAYQASLKIIRTNERYEGSITGDLPLIAAAAKNQMPTTLKVLTIWMKEQDPVLILGSPFGLVQMALKKSSAGFKYSVEEGPAKFEGDLVKLPG
jgi:CubicO group peptidase (beta-lactamase class C family)